MKRRGYSNSRNRDATLPSIENIIKEECRELPYSNLVSCAARAFIKLSAVNSIDLESILPRFSKILTMMLFEKYRCSEIEPIFEKTRRKIREVSDLVSKIFENVLVIELELVTRLTVYTRNPFLPLEIGIAWDPVLNVPYIPSSSIKGALRSYMTTKNVKVCGYSVDELLGTTESEGILVIFDAYPTSCRETLIEPEVLTPHYSETSGNIDETSAKPIPLVYPVVSAKTRFSLVIAVRKPFSKDCLRELLNVLSGALSMGIGAKTALGYGILRPT